MISAGLLQYNIKISIRIIDDNPIEHNSKGVFFFLILKSFHSTKGTNATYVANSIQVYLSFTLVCGTFFSPEFIQSINVSSILPLTPKLRLQSFFTMKL